MTSQIISQPQKNGRGPGSRHGRKRVQKWGPNNPSDSTGTTLRGSVLDKFVESGGLVKMREEKKPLWRVAEEMGLNGYAMLACAAHPLRKHLLEQINIIHAELGERKAVPPKSAIYRFRYPKSKASRKSSASRQLSIPSPEPAVASPPKDADSTLVQVIEKVNKVSQITGENPKDVLLKMVEAYTPTYIQQAAEDLYNKSAALLDLIKK